MLIRALAVKMIVMSPQPGDLGRTPSAVMAAVTLVALATLVVSAMACGSGDGGSDGAGTPIVIVNGSSDASDDGDDGGEATDAAASPSEADDSGDGEGDDQDVPEDVDACALLTTDEVGAAIGVSVDDGERFDEPPFFDCQWSTGAGSVDLSLVTGERADVESYFKIGHESDEEVDDVGEQAYWRSALHTLEVLTGNYSVAVSSSGSGELTLEAATDLVKKAIERLP